MNTYADDLLALFEHLELKNTVMIGHSTGGGEVIRFMGRRGSTRISKAILVAAIPPLMLKTDANPEGTPMFVFDDFCTALQTDRAQFFHDVPSDPFFSFNRPGPKISHGLVESWYQQAMICGFKSAHDCITVFSETDMTEDMRGCDVPVLVIHGGTIRLFPLTEIERLNQDILEFIESRGRMRRVCCGAEAGKVAIAVFRSWRSSQ